MASHPTYPHQGPGPTYYQQTPQHPVYGSHSPVPRPNYYGYQAPPPPHMNSNHPGQYHQPGPSRGNHRGGHHGGSYSSRGNHNYQNYHQPHHQPQYAQSHVNTSLGVHPPHPQHAGQHLPYSPQAVKYNQPFSPTYSYPSPTAPVFTPSWQTQQALSPLPKQLSMPLPQNVTQTFYEPPPAPPPLTEVTPTPASPIQPPIKIHFENPEPPLEDAAQTDLPASPVSPPIVTLPATSSPKANTASLPHTSYSQMGTIHTSDSVPSPSSTSASLPSSDAITNPIVKWAIWSRRPQDPSHAPSIIISPRARPPPDVVQQALDIKTPPPSVPTSPALVTKHVPLPEHEITATEEDVMAASQTTPLSSEESANIAETSQTNSSVPSSSVTETTETPTVPASPASSHTSLSASGNLVKDAKDTVIPSVEADAVLATVEPVAVSGPATSETPASLTDLTPTSATESVTEEQTEPSSKAATPTPDALANPTTTPTPSILPTPAPAPKKSWASLLRPTGASAQSPAGATRNALPTSSVVGFSIPATTTTPPLPVSPTKKSDLITLLTTSPSQASGFAAAAAGGNAMPSSMSKIRPRGLVNSGNMCFANSVLQMLVYCPPFHRLFVELGKVLVGPVVGGGNAITAGSSASVGNASGTSTPINGKPESTTPLVDATIQFLNEFIEDKKAKAKVKVVSRVVVGSSGGSGRGKGKEREVIEEQDAEGDWDGDSFLPTYVYDAMKAKKRFDNMRGGHQEDAEEFFGFYLDTLEEELLSILNAVLPPKSTKTASAAAAVEEKEEAAPPEDDGWLEVGKRNRMVVTRTIKATESPITRIFGGKFRSTLRAPGQKDSGLVEDWRSLRLDIQREQIQTIQDALSYISHPQSVQLTQAKSGVTVEGQQQVLIEALPPILVLHMKRFYYDPTVNGVVKIGKQVRFGPELEISPDVMVPSAKKASPARYKLFGALYHHGQSASGGHYTLDILHPNRYPGANAAAKPREGWVRIDDDLVSDVRHEDVFEGYERDDSRCAYLLFYRKI